MTISALVTRASRRHGNPVVGTFDTPIQVKSGFPCIRALARRDHQSQGRTQGRAYCVPSRSPRAARFAVRDFGEFVPPPRTSQPRSAIPIAVVLAGPVLQAFPGIDDRRSRIGLDPADNNLNHETF
jgi:hypothetical protein